MTSTNSSTATLPFLQNILDLYFKHFKLSEDVVNRILQVVLDLQHFKSSLFIFAATILQSSSAIHHISNIDNYVHQIIKFQSILITSSHSLWSSQSFGHQKAINGFDMPLPVAVCSGLVNPLAPRKANSSLKSVDGKTPVGFDKKKLECFNCHNTSHFAKECTAKGTHDGKKKKDSLYQHQEAGKQEKNQMGLLTMDDGIVNWGEHTEAEEINHALMAISSSNEVTLCSKTCIDSYNNLKLLYDEQMNQLGDQEA
ncbi:ribonuclease H-like domain-containing protein [Tanacetum coccineum]